MSEQNLQPSVPDEQPSAYMASVVPSEAPAADSAGSQPSDSSAATASDKPDWWHTARGKKVLIGVGSGLAAAIIVIVLVVTLVVAPNQRAAEAAAAASAASASASAASASAQAQVEQEHQAAVTAFDQASQACTSANAQLASAISSAQQTAKTDPATMQDPTLIDKLNQAITTAQAVTPCTAPSMADDTTAIQQQTTKLKTDTQTVTSATTTVRAVTQAVTTSVQDKKDADAAAAAAKAAKIKKGSLDLKDSDGYTLNFAWTNVSVVATVDTTQGKPGDAVVFWHLESNVTVTNTTPGKQAPGPNYVIITPLYDTDICKYFPDVQKTFPYNFNGTYCDYLSHNRYEWGDPLEPVTIDGKTYVQMPFLSLTYNWINKLDVGAKVVDPTQVGTDIQTEVAAANAQPLATALANPSLLVVTSDEYTNPCVGTMKIPSVGSMGNKCIIGGSAW